MRKPKRVRIAKYPAVGAPQVREIENSMEAMQFEVGGGYFEQIGAQVPGLDYPDVAAFCNENGERFGPNENVNDRWGWNLVRGPVIVMRCDPDTGEMIDLTDADLAVLHLPEVGTARI